MSEPTHKSRPLGFAGRVASAFINSKLTPLLVIASILLGVMAVMQTPREEEPQIIVPMMDVIVTMPGATSSEVEQRITTPLEKLIWEIPGVEYVYSTSSPGQSMVIVRYYVGQDQTASMVKLREKLQSHFDIIPPGASQPIIKARSIDDVPILALTLHSAHYDDYALHQMALRVETAIKQVEDVSETTIIGGRPRELQAVLDKNKMAEYGLTASGIAGSLTSQNTSEIAGALTQPAGEVDVRSGQFIKNADDLAGAVVATNAGRPVHISDVASVKNGPGDPTSYVYFGEGRASEKGNGPMSAIEPAATISVAKRPGINAIDVINHVMDKVNSLRGTIVPSDVAITVTRDYGATATEKSNDLLFHMLLAVISVTILIALTLGRRESIVVAIAIPVTLALTLLVFYLLGYTLNRITLFALIFSIGILVDDAIVVVENIVRHFRSNREHGATALDTTIRAVDEVGNPTVLATFTVIASILPLAFVGGLMGPYMRPIPIGASAAMLFSLAVAFMVTPYLAIRLLGKEFHDEDSGAASGAGAHKEDWVAGLYRRTMAPLIRYPWARWTFLSTLVVLLLASCSLFAFKLVTVKMLPFDNKNEFQIIVDMPSGTTLEQTAAATRAIGSYIATAPEVTDYEMYVGTSSPFNFNGLVRHYFMRAASYQADIQVNLLPKADRKSQSHEIVTRLRPGIAAIAKQWNVRVKVAEVPPGPPVLETLVAEIYGPTFANRLTVAQQVKHVMQTTPGVTDVDWYVDDRRTEANFIIDKQKAALAGVNETEIENTLRIALAGESIGLAHDQAARENVDITLRLPRRDRTGINDLLGLYVPSRTGQAVPLIELVTVKNEAMDGSIYHKNLMPVVYVTGDVIGKQASPVYAILAMNPRLGKIRIPEGGNLNVLSIHPPLTTDKTAMKWDGEWYITYEVFRDMGVAFAVVMVLIYLLVVGWFQSFKAPLAIMAPIPMTLIGILPAHALLGAYFTATSMIGIIAGAGIITRNSIIIVDFIELRLRQGMPLDQAVIDAGATRFRPILLTAAAVAVGAVVILADPIFQGLAISLMAGAIASTMLSLPAVPVLYFMLHRKDYEAKTSGGDTKSPQASHTHTGE